MGGADLAQAEAQQAQQAQAISSPQALVAPRAAVVPGSATSTENSEVMAILPLQGMSPGACVAETMAGPPAFNADVAEAMRRDAENKLAQSGHFDSQAIQNAISTLFGDSHAQTHAHTSGAGKPRKQAKSSTRGAMMQSTATAAAGAGRGKDASTRQHRKNAGKAPQRLSEDKPWGGFSGS